MNLEPRSGAPAPAAGPRGGQEIQALLNRKDFAAADRAIEGRLRLDPEDADAHYLKGVSLFLQGQLGTCVQSLKRALAIDPQHTDAAVSLSVLFNDIGKYDEAKKVFQNANQSVAHRGSARELGIDKKFAVKHLELADMYFRYRRFDEAIEEYTKASLLDPSTLEIRIRRAKALAKKGFLTRSMQELQQLKGENPDYVPARLQLGLLHYSQGNLLDAELEWEAVLERQPTHREAAAYLEMARSARMRDLGGR